MASSAEQGSPFQAQFALSSNQKTLLCLVGLGSMLEFWDAYLIGFIMAFLVGPWGLTYGVLGAVLIASGMGAVVGGLIWGSLADSFGRKPVLVGSMLLTSIASLCLAFTPEGDWLYMAVFRVIIGFGTGGFFVQIALVQEFVPSHRRGMLTGIVSAITTGGLLLGAFSGAFVVPYLGWRGTFALGAGPALIAIVAAWVVPESPRWLRLQGRIDEARRAAAWAIGCSPQEVVFSRLPAVPAVANWFELFKWPRSMVTTFAINVGLIAGYYGIVLWAPTLVAQIERVSATEVSRVIIGFSLLGVAARLVAGYCADRIGRRTTGGLLAGAAGLMVIVAGYVGHGDIADPGLFWIPLLVAFVCADGSFAVCAVYSTEIWPSRLRGSGSGFGGLSGSIGKIIGPLGLAQIAGSSNVVMPSATVDVIVPAFWFLGCCILLCAVTYHLVGIEAKGKSLEAIDEAVEGNPPARVKAPSGAQ